MTNATNNQAQEYVINDQLLFEMLKLEIRGTTIAYTAMKKESDKQEQILDKKIDDLHKNII
jgi:hypothetical protein